MSASVAGAGPTTVPLRRISAPTGCEVTTTVPAPWRSCVSFTVVKNCT
jgi:hypothetical protein